MTYLIIWLLLGSLSLNILYIKRAMEPRLLSPKAKLGDFVAGLVFGLIIGPLSIPFHFWINRRLK